MAIGDDFSATINGAALDIRHVANNNHYTVLEGHRWLQQLAYQGFAASGDDQIDISTLNPSDKSYDTIITLKNGCNIDDDAAQYFYGGSIAQGSGATETVYYGLKIVGYTDTSTTQIQAVQDNKMYDGDAPFWGTQAAPYNGSGTTLAQFLVKGREYGCDIDQRKIRVQARPYGDTPASFDVVLEPGVNTAAIYCFPDPQNTTAQGTVTNYTHVTNSGTVLIDDQDETDYDDSPVTEGTFSGGSGHADGDIITLECGCTATVDAHSIGAVTQFTIRATNCTGANDAEQIDQVSTTGSGTAFYLTLDEDNVEIDPDRPVGGYQVIDIDDGNGDQPYYSKWTYGADTSGDGMKGMWEYHKDLTGTGTAKVHTGVDAELFRGLTHYYGYDGLTGVFREGETLVWGTQITYDTLAGGTFTPGFYVRIGSNGATGRIMYDDGTDDMIIALEDTSVSMFDLVDAQDETSYDNSPTTEGTFSGGSDHATNDVITMDCGCDVTVDNHSTGTVTEFTVDNTNCTGAFSGVQIAQSSTDGIGTAFSLTPDDDNVAVQTDEETITEYQVGVILTNSQDETSYDNSPTTEGTFSGGTGHANGDVLTLASGATVLVDNQTGSVVDQFTVTSTGCRGVKKGDQDVQVSTDGAGRSFYLIPDVDNLSSVGATGVTADINTSSVVDNDLEGGMGVLLGDDATGTDHYIMALTGGDPVDNSYVYGLMSGANCSVNTAVSTPAIPAVFFGSYTGSTIGAFGFGVDKDDLSAPDTVEDLDGDTNPAPNNQTWYLYGLVTGEDRCLVGQKDTGDAFKWDQMTLSQALDQATGETSAVVGSIPDNTPSTGYLRVTLDDGRHRPIEYTAHNGTTTFTIVEEDWSDPDDAAISQGVMVAVIDKTAESGTESYTTKVDSAPQDLRVRVRDGGATPIKEYETNSQLTATGGSATASRVSD